MLAARTSKPWKMFENARRRQMATLEELIEMGLGLNISRACKLE
jgi:hypothetical protein